MYQHGFLPAVYQPTMLRPGSRPVLNLDLPAGVSLGERRKTIDLIIATFCVDRGHSLLHDDRDPRNEKAPGVATRGSHDGIAGYS